MNAAGTAADDRRPCARRKAVFLKLMNAKLGSCEGFGFGLRVRSPNTLGLGGPQTAHAPPPGRRFRGCLRPRLVTLAASDRTGTHRWHPARRHAEAQACGGEVRPTRHLPPAATCNAHTRRDYPEASTHRTHRRMCGSMRAIAVSRTRFHMLLTPHSSPNGSIFPSVALKSAQLSLRAGIVTPSFWMSTP